MSDNVANGTVHLIGGKRRIYYDGYWIRWYPPPAGNQLESKKALIHALTRRLFNHVEYGINVPSFRVEEARRAYECERDPERKRVNGAMLAGALFNRAAGILAKLVELQALGVTITPEDTLMEACGACLLEALQLGTMVRHRRGDEGIDELWGEPFKAFSMPLEDFFASRYIKIAQTMREIDCIAKALGGALEDAEVDADVPNRILELVQAAKAKCETSRTDPDVFHVWPTFVVACDQLAAIDPNGARRFKLTDCEPIELRHLVLDGIDLLTHIARARVPMPKSTSEFIDRCEAFRQQLQIRRVP